MLFRTLILKTAGSRPVKSLVTKTRLFRPMVQRFIAGETLDDAMRVAESLASSGLLVTLDLLGENVATAEEADRSTDAYIDIIDRIATSPHRDKVNISIKLTALGLDQGDDVAEANYRRLLGCAGHHSIFVRADMEASEYTERTIRLVETVFPDHPNTGTVLQSMLKRTPEDVERLIQLGCRVRIVKGAYLEPESVAHQEKSVVDAQYVEAAEALLSRGNYPAIATHDEALIDKLTQFVTEHSVTADRFEWQMLYGIRRDLQDGLRAKGYNVRVYVPYGAQWYPYFTRRLAERPANLLFILKSLFKK